MPPAPITANMSNFDPIPRLQQIAATVENGGHFDSPVTAAHYINCAIEEIKRLRQENATLTAERDEARRELCRIESSASGDPNMTSRAVAADLGWDCFKEDALQRLNNLAQLVFRSVEQQENAVK